MPQVGRQIGGDASPDPRRSGFVCRTPRDFTVAKQVADWDVAAVGHWSMPSSLVDGHDRRIFRLPAKMDIRRAVFR